MDGEVNFPPQKRREIDLTIDLQVSVRFTIDVHHVGDNENEIVDVGGVIELADLSGFSEGDVNFFVEVLSSIKSGREPNISVKTILPSQGQVRLWHEAVVKRVSVCSEVDLSGLGGEGDFLGLNLCSSASPKEQGRDNSDSHSFHQCLLSGF